MEVTKPYKFIGFGAIDVTKPYNLIGFGATDVTKPYTCIGFGAIDVTKPIDGAFRNLEAGSCREAFRLPPRPKRRATSSLTSFFAKWPTIETRKVTRG